MGPHGGENHELHSCQSHRNPEKEESFCPEQKECRGYTSARQAIASHALPETFCFTISQHSGTKVETWHFTLLSTETDSSSAITHFSWASFPGGKGKVVSVEGLEQEGKGVKKQQKENVMRCQCSSSSYTSAHHMMPTEI